MKQRLVRLNMPCGASSHVILARLYTLYTGQTLSAVCNNAPVDLYLALFSMLCVLRSYMGVSSTRLYIYSGQGIRPYRAPLCILSPLGGPSMCGIC